MVNAPFIQKYTIPKAQWKSLVEATFRIGGVVEVPIICVHMGPAPLEPRQSPRTTPLQRPTAHGSVTETRYNHDEGFPQRTETQQLQREGKHLGLLVSVWQW